MAARGFDAPGEIPFPDRCSDFPRDSPASSSSRPRSTATPAASSWRPTAPTRWAAEGVPTDFVQDNHSRSRRGTLRGLHFQTHPGQGKLVRCARGRVLDVVVDLRRGSPTFGEWEGFELDDEAGHQLFIPVGFGHGFCVLSETADFVYKCTAYYDAATEKGIRFDDPDVGVVWPERRRAPVLRARPRRAPARRDRGRAPVPLRGMTAHRRPLRPEPDGHAARRQPPHGRCSRGSSRAAPARASSCGWRTSTRAASSPAPPSASSATCARSAWTGTARSIWQSTRAEAYEHATARLPASRATSTSASAPAPRSAPRAPRPTARCRRAPIPAPASSSPRPRGAASAPAGARRRCASRANAARVAFTDRLHGPQEGVVDDFVVRRNDGAPAYNLAVVVDDAWQQIGEVVRGDDLLETTPRQLFLAGLLGVEPPAHAHVPLVARPGRGTARQAPRRRDARRGGRRHRRRLDGAHARPAARDDRRRAARRLRSGRAPAGSHPLRRVLGPGHGRRRAVLAAGRAQRPVALRSVTASPGGATGSGSGGTPS